MNLRRPLIFEETYAEPRERPLVNDDIREFVVDELRKLDLSRMTANDNDIKTKNAIATLSSLHDACSSLDFKVSQEIFGKNPEDTFKKLLDFWMHRFIDVMCSNAYSFLNRRNIFPNLAESVLILKIVDVVHDITYDDYFKALEKLKDDDKKLAEECDKYFSNKVIPKLKTIFPSLVTEEEIVSAISEFKIPEMWCSNTANEGEK